MLTSINHQTEADPAVQEQHKIRTRGGGGWGLSAAHLLLVVVPVEHPPQVAVAVAGAAPEREPDSRCLPGPAGRISSHDEE